MSLVVAFAESVLSDEAERCEDEVLLNLWHPLGYASDWTVGEPKEDKLLGYPLEVVRVSESSFEVVSPTEGGRELPTIQRFGYLWTSLGTPRALFEIPESQEEDRRKVHAGTIDVRISAGRAMENFLDMGHFPFVHEGVLGTEPRTEVKDYNVTSSVQEIEILATDCLFYQPKAAGSSTQGAEVEYAYRVMHPNCAALFKSSPNSADRLDVITLFIQPLNQEHIRAHMWLCLLDDESPEWALKRFQMDIFGHDKPILENQLPKRLPLDPRAETPIRADKTAVAYRRMLSQLGVRYGVIPGAMKGAR